MLDELIRYARIVHVIEPDEAQRVYLEAIFFLDQSSSAFGDALNHPASAPIRERLRSIALASQELAYEFYHHYGYAIADDAINPESFKYDYLPPGHRPPRLEKAELRQELVRYLRDRFSHTFPSEKR